MGTITELLLCMCVYCSRMLGGGGGLIFSSLCFNLMCNILEFEDSYVDIESYLQFITFFTAVYSPLAKAIMALPFSFFCLWIDARFNFFFFFILMCLKCFTSSIYIFSSPLIFLSTFSLAVSLFPRLPWPI